MQYLQAINIKKHNLGCLDIRYQSNNGKIILIR